MSRFRPRLPFGRVSCARWVSVFAALAFLLCASRSFAIDKRVEAGAKDAMRKAEAEFVISDYDKAIGRLERALRACGSSKCTVVTKSRLWRDLGVMQLRKGERDDALTSFSTALKFDPKTYLDPSYEADDTHALFAAAQDLASAGHAEQPTGDFEHTPASEGLARTPLPIYVEFNGGTSPAQVVVKYKPSGGDVWKRLTLARKDKGWGGLVPCGSVPVGVLRYYIQGFDAAGSPTLNSGDPKRPFVVPIRPSISGEPPSLPGMPPPRRCTEAEALAPEPGEVTPRPLQEDGGVCSADAQCKSEVCQDGACAARAHKRQGGRKFARYWVGLSGSVDLLSMPGGDDVCLRTASGEPANAQHYYCTDPNHGDYPVNQAQNGLLSAGTAGQAQGGLHSGDYRPAVTFDYAFTGNLLLGGRLGYVMDTYASTFNGKAAVTDGRAFGPPVHIEGRATYVLGEDPLVRSGFAPYGFAALGVAPFDAHQTVMVTETGVAGQRPILAFVTGGPFFLAAGGGARYAFSARAAFLVGIKVTGAIGANGFLPEVSPELAFQVGF